MDWGEAWRLFEVLAADPGSQIAAALAGWEHPASHDLQVLYDVYDLTHKIAAGKRAIKPYPRPWDRRKTRFGKTSRPRDEVIAILRSRAPARDVPRQGGAGRRRDERGRFAAG